MSDSEDPYAVSSDSEDEENFKKPPPKITIEGRASNIKDLKAAITETKESAKDEKRKEEIEELRKAKAAEMAKMKKEFEEGKVHNVENLDKTTTSEGESKGLNKEVLSAFKTKFEKMQENETLDDHLKTLALEGVGKENMAQMKEAFEKVQKGELTVSDIREGKGLDLSCSEADRRRIMAAFLGPKSEDDIPKNCALCNKTVYPVERLFAHKQLYHNDCFRCKTCNKKLSATQYNIHDNVLYCKPHYMEVLHPDRTFNVEDLDNEENEDDEYAIVSKPKQLSSDVVRAGTNIGDELQQIKSLKEKKECWQSSIKASDHVEKKSDEILEGITGHVKDRMSKIISGGDKSDSENEENDDKKKQLDAIKAQVGEIKNKWKTGEVEKAETKDAEFKDELEQLRKGGINVRNRFSERLQPADDENILKSYDRNELDTSSAAEARKSFLQGLAYQSGPVEKTATDLDNLKFTELNAFKNKFEKGESEESVGKRERQIVDLDIQLNSIKEQLEKGGVEEADMTPEDRAERKKKEIEAEFLRYKLARKRQAKKAEEAAASEPEPSDQQDKPHLDVEVKMAGKAREKFKKIEAENPIVVPVPKQTSSKSGKWDVKKDTNVEIVNRRAVEESTSEEDDESAFDVKNLMQKFKNIQSTDSKVERTNLEELEALRQQAKNLRQQFEKKTEMDDEQVEEKKKELAEEFQRLKEERAKMQDELKAEEFDRKSHREIEKEDLQIAADHASKMAAKWEKINKKEARKAEKSKMPTKS